MSNLPSFLPPTNPHQPIFTSGEPNPLSPVEITALQKEMSALHFRPHIVVVPATYHLKDGSTLVSEIASSWKLGPHSLLVVYSPADKNVWVQSGAFNSSAGVDPAFFKHDFLQRMSANSQDGNLASALTASLKDVDQIIVRSQAFAAAQVNRQTSTRTEGETRHPNHTGHHETHGGSSMMLQILPAILAAVVVLNFIGRALNNGAPRQRFDDSDDKPADLSDDVDRILEVIHSSQGGATRGAAKLRNTQVPMAEFKKRADSPVKLSAQATETSRVNASSVNASSVNASSSNGAQLEGQNSAFARASQQDDHSTELKAAIDSSAAKVRREHKERIASTDYSTSASLDESPPAVVQDGRFIDSYVATFSGLSPTPKETAPPIVPTLGDAGAGAGAEAAASTPSQPLDVSTYASSSMPVNFPASVNIPTPTNLPTSVNISTPINLSAPTSTPVISSTDSFSTPAPASSSFDLSAFSLQAASAPFADVLSSMGTPLGEMKTSSGGSLPLGSLSSFDTNRDTSAVQTACPKCSEPKSKDFSFCLKCGFNF
jgi:hypothetical protein